MNRHSLDWNTDTNNGVDEPAILVDPREAIRAVVGNGIALYVKRNLGFVDPTLHRGICEEIVDKVAMHASEESDDLCALCLRISMEVCSKRAPHASHRSSQHLPAPSSDSAMAKSVLRSVAPSAREALCLFYEGTSEREIGELLLIGPETLRHLKARARDQFTERRWRTPLQQTSSARNVWQAICFRLHRFRGTRNPDLLSDCSVVAGS